jgi:membrane protease YdiL (CAAX protease family)
MNPNFIQKHPIWSFLLFNFGWTWLFWLAAIPFRGQTLLVLALVMLGGYGPALGAILTLLGRQNTPRRLTSKQALTWALAAALIFGLMALRYLVGNVPGYETLAADLTLTAPVILICAAASLVGGWVVSYAVAPETELRARFATLLPRRDTLGWTLFGLLFYPLMILLAWGLAAVLGLGVEFPGLWGRPLAQTLPLYALTFALVAVSQGGNEEPGWRGFLQPELQQHRSPLTAALIVALAWSLWHLPLYLNGFYGGSLVGGMLGSGIFRVFLAIFLAWVYNRSGGNLLAMVLLHTSFNVMVNFLPTSDVGLLILWLLTAVGVVVWDKMARAPHPVESAAPLEVTHG